MNLNHEKIEEIYRKMEILLLQLDGSIGLPLQTSSFVTKDGFDLGSTTEGKLEDDPYRISYLLNGECLDDFPHLNEFDIWDKKFSNGTKQIGNYNFLVAV